MYLFFVTSVDCVTSVDLVTCTDLAKHCVLRPTAARLSEEGLAISVANQLSNLENTRECNEWRDNVFYCSERLPEHSSVAMASCVS